MTVQAAHSPRRGRGGASADPRILLRAIRYVGRYRWITFLAYGSLIVATESGQIYSIDTGTNQQKLLATLKEQIFAPLAAAGGVLYAHTAGDIMYAIDAKSGTSLWNFDLKAK